jgi:uncharacterized protein
MPRVRLPGTRWLLGVGALVALAVPLRIAYRAWADERRTFASSRHAPKLSVSELGIDGLREVELSSRDGSRIRGVYTQPKQGALIVMVHGSTGDRSDVANEARILAGAGFGVLALDLPGQGLSEGKVTWGRSERLAISGALDWAVKQAGVDPERLGVFGFSLGGYVALQTAVVDPRIKAVAAAGTMGSYYEHTFWEYRRYGFLRQWPALLAKRQSGMQPNELVPQEVIGRIAPRSVLLVTGTADQLVPSWMTERLFAAAHEPKRLFVVEGARHGQYFARDPQGYADALRSFFMKLTG